MGWLIALVGVVLLVFLAYSFTDRTTRRNLGRLALVLLFAAVLMIVLCLAVVRK